MGGLFQRQQSCNAPEYLLFEIGDACCADDLAFWRAEVEWHETTLDVERSERLTESLEYCTNYYENVPAYVQDCATQAYYVDALTHMAGPALADWKAGR